MDRLTQRDKKGKAYFNNDGVLIRGANGTFHQKKDMTAHYIHDRFVALDKVIDRFAAYEDTGLTPEEVQDLVNKQKNEPLKLEELKEMHGEPVWLKSLGEDFDDGWYIIVSIDKQRIHCLQLYSMLFFEHYGKTWIAYRHKPKE